MSSQELRIVSQIEAVLSVHEQLKQYAETIQVTIENTVIILRGRLPSNDLQRALVPCVRQAGVMGRVDNCVQVA